MVVSNTTGILDKKTKARGGTVSVGADSLMGHLDMSKLLDKETLERGRAVVTMESRNLQIGEVIDAIAQTEPELFGKGTATLMPVKHSGKLDIPICDAHINNLTPYDGR